MAAALLQAGGGGVLFEGEVETEFWGDHESVGAKHFHQACTSIIDSALGLTTPITVAGNNVRSRKASFRQKVLQRAGAEALCQVSFPQTRLFVYT